MTHVVGRGRYARETYPGPTFAVTGPTGPIGVTGSTGPTGFTGPTGPEGAGIVDSRFFNGPFVGFGSGLTSVLGTLVSVHVTDPSDTVFAWGSGQLVNGGAPGDMQLAIVRNSVVQNSVTESGIATGQIINMAVQHGDTALAPGVYLYDLKAAAVSGSGGATGCSLSVLVTKG